MLEQQTQPPATAPGSPLRRPADARAGACSTPQQRDAPAAAASREDSLATLLRQAVAGRVAKGPVLQRTVRVPYAAAFGGIAQFTTYEQLRNFLAEATGLQLKDPGLVARLVDHERVGIAIGPAEAEILAAHDRLKLRLGHDFWADFGSAHALAIAIAREFTPLVESVPGTQQSEEAPGGIWISHPQQPDTHARLAYADLVAVLRTNCGLELVSLEQLQALTTVSPPSAEAMTIVSQASQLLATMSSTTGTTLAGHPSALAFFVLTRHPALVVAAPTFATAAMSESMSFVMAMLPLVYELVTETTTTQLPPVAWMFAMANVSPEMRKELAAALFTVWFTDNGPDIAHELVARKLDGIRSVCALTSAQIELDGGRVLAAFRASPAKFVPLAVTGKLSGLRSGAQGGKQELEALQCDGPFASPAGEFITQFNARFAHEVYDPSSNAKIDELATTQKNATELSSIPKKTYRRPGKVKATITESKPSAGRTGTGETEIGWFGRDEELLATGKHTIPYEGGHLVGDQIMDGVNLFNMYEDWNLAPQAKSFNNPLYITAIENASVKALAAGAELVYKVTVKYPCDSYQVKPSVAASRAIAPTTTMRDGATFHAALDALLKLKPGLDAPDFRFTTRVPTYWHARAEDSLGKNLLAGKGRQDPRGPYSPTIDATTSYTPIGKEQFTYTLIVDAKTLAMPIATGKKRTEVTYTLANKVKVKARQATFSV